MGYALYFGVSTGWEGTAALMVRCTRREPAVNSPRPSRPLCTPSAATHVARARRPRHPAEPRNWHAHPDEFDADYVGHVLAALATQEQRDRDQFRLKGRPGDDRFVDLTTRYAWQFVGLAKLTWDETYHIRGNYPTKRALQHLFNSRGSESPANWIADETGISTHDIPEWVWTNEKRGPTHALAFNMHTGRFKEACTVHRRRSQPYLAGQDVRQGPDKVGQINGASPRCRTSATGSEPASKRLCLVDTRLRACRARRARRARLPAGPRTGRSTTPTTAASTWA